MNTDSFKAKHISPYLEKRLLSASARPFVAITASHSLLLRRRQRPPVDLAVGRQRQCVQHDKGRWDHVLRHSLSEIPSQLSDAELQVGALHRISYQISYQAPHGLLSRCQHDRLSHGWM